LNDGKETRRYSLNRSYMGVYVPRMTWRTMENFSTNSLCLVLSSMPYDPSDYIWDYDSFIKELKSKTILSVRQQTDISPLLSAYNSPVTTVYNCNVFELPKEHNRAGNLTALNNGVEVPFDVKRIYYTYDIPSGATRGGHAHRGLCQYLIAASSSFDVLLDDGCNKKLIHLDRPNFALQIVPGIWRELLNFSSGAICMVLASEKYDESDYIRDYQDFLSFKSCKL